MSPIHPNDPGDPAHVAHVFGDSHPGAVLEIDANLAEQRWEDLDTSAAEDWQMLFVRAYAKDRGTA